MPYLTGGHTFRGAYGIVAPKKRGVTGGRDGTPSRVGGSTFRGASRGW